MGLKFDIKPGDHILLLRGSVVHPAPWEYIIHSVDSTGLIQYEVVNGPPAISTLQLSNMSDDWILSETSKVARILTKYQ